MSSFPVSNNIPWSGSTKGIWASLVAQMVINLPAKQETQVQSLVQEDPLEEEMANHSSILVWRISWTEEPGGLHVHVVMKSWAWLSHTTPLVFIHSSTKRYMDCFQVLEIIKIMFYKHLCAAICVATKFSTTFGKYERVQLLSCIVTVSLIVWETAIV